MVEGRRDRRGDFAFRLPCSVCRNSSAISKAQQAQNGRKATVRRSGMSPELLK